MSGALTASVAIELEKRMDARLLSAIGFALFAIGMSAFQDSRTDYDQMFWPQIVRGGEFDFDTAGCSIPWFRQR